MTTLNRETLRQVALLPATDQTLSRQPGCLRFSTVAADGHYSPNQGCAQAACIALQNSMDHRQQFLPSSYSHPPKSDTNPLLDTKAWVLTWPFHNEECAHTLPRIFCLHKQTPAFTFPASWRHTPGQTPPAATQAQ